MKNDRLQRLMRQTVEIIISLCLVLVLFGLFTTLLFKIFPTGITLSQLVEQRKSADNQQKSGSGERSGSVINMQQGSPEKMAATLTNSEHDVKSKNASSLAWGPAQEGMSLFDRDAVQTFSQSSAQINFDSRNHLAIGSNSLIIIKRIEKDKQQNERRTAMVMVEGELQGRISAAGQSPLNLEITTPAAVSRINSKTPAQSTDFRISVNPDKSSSIVVFKGQAEVTAAGRTVRVAEGTGVTVKQGQAPRAAVRLPPPPSLLTPLDRSVVSFRETVPRTRLAWNGQPGEAFHLQLARDSAFKDIVVDKKLNEPEFVHGNLKKGKYYWRVSKLNDSCEGHPSGLRQFEMSQVLAAPELQVTFPPGPVTEAHATVTGKSTPGIKVYVGGKMTPLDASGAFSEVVPIRSGMNLVTIEAIDAAGNVTYKSQYVQGSF